ncbi:MAG: sulfotransferase domain-containing protein [Desulfuromusa sp.]|nr:sulfotransferase domain-containing protein [Desulfuromusa sp.]
MSNRIPRDAYAIIIGAMKCGTTSLYSYLKKHPEICPASVKEPEFFSENQGHGVQVENYRNLWTFDDTVHKYALEASTGYTKYPSEQNVPKNILDYGISPKFIYIIRNPFDRISSHFNFMQKNKSWLLNITDTHLINTSNYFLQLEQYKRYFPLEDILILDFDELRDNPALVLKRTYGFLDLSHRYFPKKYKVKNITETKKHTLTDSDKEFVYNELKDGMANLYYTYGFEVRKWGFDI